VAETWPEHNRAKAAGILQSAWAVGFFLAASFNLLLQGYSWRVLFLIGILPAFVSLLVRWHVKEPVRWARAHQQDRNTRLGHLAEIFAPSLRRSTLVGSTLAFVAVFGLWGSTNWAPTLVRELPDLQGVPPAAMSAYVSYAIMALNGGALFGYLGFGPLADRFGRRAVFALMCVGSLLLLPVTYLFQTTYAGVLALLPILGFFNNGIFSGFPIYLPELYPTRVRATGAGFCFNAGRVLASASPFLTGWLVSALGSFGRAASTVALIYLVGLAVLWIAPETKGKPLPD
jgi:MFS family permease